MGGLVYRSEIPATNASLATQGPHLAGVMAFPIVGPYIALLRNHDRLDQSTLVSVHLANNGTTRTDSEDTRQISGYW